MKTPWQKTYSFFGFWTYQEITMHNDKKYECHLIIYWCLWPWKFQRKIDLFHINVTKQYNKKLLKRRADFMTFNNLGE